jgi:hypothetical protein
MRVPNSEHTSRPWRIREIASDFRVEDVWEVEGSGDPRNFPRLVELVARQDPAKGSSRAARALWATRWKLGEIFGWDDPDTGVGSRVPTLRDRLPVDLRESPGPEFEELPFTSLYLTDDEFAGEVANKTVHGIMHLGLIQDGSDRGRVQLAVYVKPNGFFGKAYMAAIKPFRHLIVYPPMLRDVERQWQAASRDPAATPA